MADLGVFLNQTCAAAAAGDRGGAMGDKDFDEDDSAQNTTRACKESFASSAWRLPATTRKIPRAKSITPPPSSDAPPLLKASSEPMDIPDWSKIYGKSCEKGSMDDDGACSKGGDDEDDEMVPPHEWIARKLARSQISSFSVCEGMGRTLKGRDLSKVRNAILAKTGFIE
ncbi:uncharacterized protein LOC114189264 [Vigna unguiculata]|uniref:uncharacterized protein LOC114189264 n=1 Tax=Vigna unguiculata TaxID=3917 RepID=UPI0010161514|nr:uncharacterized protein LOC114189264 [Vigna unguiculata]